MRRREILKVAMGTQPADLAVTNARIVNVHTGEVHPGGIAVKGDRIAATGDIDYTIGPATQVVDAGQRYLAPGLVDGHLHMYHSYLGIPEFVEAMLRHGVTATTDGFYGQGIVGGMEAIRFFKDAFDRMPIRLLFLVPTLSYLQNRELGLTAAGGISPQDMASILDWPGCYGLEEPPPLPVVDEWDEFLDLFEHTLERGKVISGHAIGISERQLQAYIGMGAATDHETIEVSDGLHKARAGMKLLMRQGSGCTNVAELVRLRTEQHIDAAILGFCADVASPEKLWREGGVDENIRVAISRGVAPVEAVRMASLSVAQTFRADHDMGSVAPGRYADFLLLDDLPSFRIAQVFFGGRRVVDGDDFLADLPPVSYPQSFYASVRVDREITADDLAARAPGARERAQVRSLRVTDGSLVTVEEQVWLPVVDGAVSMDLDRDILPIAMIDRLGKGTGIGHGFVQGFGLRRGAIASTVNAVCENVLVVGANLHDMALAANTLVDIGGGKIVVADGEVRAVVELPVLGLLSEDPMQTVMAKFAHAFEEIRALGCELRSPFSQLEFCGACGEIGDLKLSEEGLVTTDPPGRVELVTAAA